MYANTSRNIHSQIAITLSDVDTGKKLSETLVHTDRYQDAVDAANTLTQKLLGNGRRADSIRITYEKV